MPDNMPKQSIAPGKQSSHFIASPENVRKLVYFVRNQQVMFDFDLALIYGYEVRALNQQVSRNIDRFPEDFMFELSPEEVQTVKSQIVTSQENTFFSGQGGGRRKPPKAFTEQGIYMLGTVLRGTVAQQQTISIMRAFKEMKHFLSSNAALFERVRAVELRQSTFEQNTNSRLTQVFAYINEHEETNQKVFFDGQIFDAFSLLADIISKAQQEIVLIDSYVNTSTLDLLTKKKQGVAVYLYTTKQGCKLTVGEQALFQGQYPSLQVSYTTSFHDRFIILDQTCAYHIGASLKDAGRKCFAINRLEDVQVVRHILNRL